jgi:ATP-dependent protease ClpP protease subunit
LEFIKKQDQAVDRLFASRSGKPVSYFQKRYERRHWFLSAREALREGLVDAILDTPDYGKKIVKK